MNFLSNKLHGLALCFAIAVPAAYLGKLFPIIGAPVFAIILGLLMAGIPRSDIFQGGITFTSKKILQYAIILLGFGMNLFEIFLGRVTISADNYLNDRHCLGRVLCSQQNNENRSRYRNFGRRRFFYLRRLSNCCSGTCYQSVRRRHCPVDFRYLPF